MLKKSSYLNYETKHVYSNIADKADTECNTFSWNSDREKE